MPAAMMYSPDDKALREEASTELKARRQMIASAWAYYMGQHKPHLKVTKKGSDDNVVVNLCKQVIDRTVSFRVPKFPDLELDELEDTEAERELRLMWRASEGPILLSDMCMTGCLAGHVFARVLPKKANQKYPRVINLDPANVLAWWQADDYKKLLWYELRWTAGKIEYRQDVVNEETRWVIYQFKREKQEESGYQTAGEKWTADGVAEIWDYPLGPIWDWQHLRMPNRYYGAGELTHAGLNDAVNKHRSDMSRILRFHASPRTFGKGFKAEAVTETAIESFWTVEDKDAEVYNVEMQSDLSSSRNMADDLTRDFFATSRVVVMHGDIKDFQRVATFGVRALYFDQIAKNNELEWQYSKGVEGVSQRLRMIAGASDYDAPVKSVWADPLPSDPLESVQVLEKEQKMGAVSTETIAGDLGRNWTQEQERIAKEGGTPSDGRSTDSPLQDGQGGVDGQQQ